jgi:hypothetical protein
MGFDLNELLGAAGDPNTSPDILAILARHEDPWVRWSVASNPSTPVEVLDGFTDETSVIALSRLAQNPSITADTLIKLAQKDNYTVRQYAAKHPNCPAAVKLWLESGDYHLGYAGMTLAEFMGKVGEDI